MTLLTSQLAPMQFLKAQTLKGSNLEHERSEGGGTNKAETSLDGASSAGGLRERRGGGAVGGTGEERAGNSHRAGGLDDGGVVLGGAGAGDVGAGGADGQDSGGVESNGGGLDDRRRSNGVASRAGLDRVSSKAGGGDGVVSGSGASDGSSRAGGDGNDAVVLGDTELGGVLVLAGNVIDQLESVAGAVSLEGGGRSPLEGTRVVDTLSKSLDGDNVDGGATEQDEGDRVGGGRLPGDGEGLASRNNLKRESVTVMKVDIADFNAYLVQRTSDGVASRLANRGVELRGGNAGENSNDGGLGEHFVGII